jgi:hypothetical protein
MATLERLIASWYASADLHSFEGATALEIGCFEASAGWRLPTEWRQLYAFANGADLSRVASTLSLGPAKAPNTTVLSNGRLWTNSGLRGAWESGKFGRWLPAASQETGAVVEMLWPNFGLVIGGSPLRAYLLARTVYDLICYNGATRPSMP